MPSGVAILCLYYWDLSKIVAFITAIGFSGGKKLPVNLVVFLTVQAINTVNAGHVNVEDLQSQLSTRWRGVTLEH